MRHQIVRAVLAIASISAAAAAPAVAARLAGIRPETLSSVTIVRIQVNGSFLPGELKRAADPPRWYIDLPRVAPRSSATDHFDVPAGDPRLREIVAAPRDNGTRLTFHVNADVDARPVRDSRGGLAIEFRGGEDAAPAPARSTRRPRRQMARNTRTAPPPPVRREMAEMAEVLRPKSMPPATPAVAAPPSPTTPMQHGGTRREPSPAPTPVDFVAAPPPGVRPPTSEDQVDATQTVVEFHPGEEHALIVVLMRQKGQIAFTRPGEPRFALFVFQAPAWEPVPLENGMIALDPYLALPLPAGESGLADTLRDRQHVPPEMAAYAVFPEDFYGKVLAQVRKAAAERGVVGKVVAASVVFDPGTMAGVRVDELKVPAR